MYFSTLTSVFFFAGLGLTQHDATTPLNAASSGVSSWTNHSSFQEAATIQIQIGGLSGSGVISLNSIAITPDSSLFTPALMMSDSPRQTDGFPNLCDTTSVFNTTATSPHYANITSLFNTTTIPPRNTDITSLFNTTTIPPRFANSTSNFNATAGPSAPRPSTTPTAPSIFTGSGVLTKPVLLDIYALFAAIVIQIAVI